MATMAMRRDCLPQYQTSVEQRGQRLGRRLKASPGAPLVAALLIFMSLLVLRWLWVVYQYEIAPLDGHFMGPVWFAGMVYYETTSKFSARWAPLRPEWPAPLWVISQPSQSGRRADMTAQLTAQQLDHEFFDGVDGVEAYHGRGPGARLRDVFFRRDAPGQWDIAAQVPGTVGCVGSHLRLLQRMVWEGHEIAIVLEDDALLAPDFAAGVAAALADLPSDWDVLYLNTCDHRTGGTYHAWGQRVGPRARHLRLAVCTVGYVARYTHAHRTLLRETFRVKEQIDWIFIRAVKNRQLNAFVADPPLVTWTPRWRNSTVDSADSIRIGKLHGAYPARKDFGR